MGKSYDIMKGLTALGCEIGGFRIGKGQRGDPFEDIFQGAVNRAAFHGTDFFQRTRREEDLHPSGINFMTRGINGNQVPPPDGLEGRLGCPSGPEP